MDYIPPQAAPPALAPRARLFDEFVVVEGITRSGKFLLASVLSAFEGLEFIQYSVTFENLLLLLQLGKIDFEACRSLVHLEFDYTAYNMAIGRYLNTRPFDISCIHRAPDPERFLARSQIEDREELIRRFRDEKLLPLHVWHEGLPNARKFFDVFPKARMLSIVRDPAALMVSWFNRGWGRRTGANDPVVMSLSFEAAGGPRPWWAVNWTEDYANLAEMDRCVLSIARLQELARRELDAAGPALTRRIRFVRYETLLEHPDAVVGQARDFLGRKPGEGLPAIMVRERLPRVVPSDQRAKLLEKIGGLMSPQFKPELERACAEYDSYWSTLANAV